MKENLLCKKVIFMFPTVQRSMGLMFDLHGVLKNGLSWQHLKQENSLLKSRNLASFGKKTIKYLAILGPCSHVVISRWS